MITLDIETRSTLNVVTHGLYAHAPTATVLGMRYRLAPGEPLLEWRGHFADGVNPDASDSPPTDLIEAVQTGEMIVAHNAAYERVVLRNQPWWPGVPIEQFACSAAWAACFNLPRALDGLSRMLLPEDKLKMSAIGKRLSYMWNAAYPLSDPDHMDEQMLYCGRDVESMEDCLDCLPPFDPVFLEEYWANEHINDRGVVVDTDLAEAIIAMKPAIDHELLDSLDAATGGGVKLRGPTLLAWLQGALPEDMVDLLTTNKKIRQGYGFKTVPKVSADKTVRAALQAAMEDRDDVSHIRRALNAYDEANKAAVTKFNAAMMRVTPDGVLRGQFVYAGAGQTRRFSSYGVQVHNLKRDVAPDATDVIDVLKHNRHQPQVIPGLLGGRSANDAASEVLRPMFTAPPGGSLVWGDWSAIEARVLPWLAGGPGGDKVLDVFRGGGDIYKAEASGIYGKPVEDIDKAERQVGKVACLAGDTLVLVKDHLNCITAVPISLITEAHMVWDGVTWVGHDGLAYNGEQECLTLSGMKLTPDHLIWCGIKHGWMEAGRVASSGKLNCLALETATGSLSSLGISHTPQEVCTASCASATAAGQSIVHHGTTSKGGEPPVVIGAAKTARAIREVKNIWRTLRCVLTSTTAVAFSTVSQLSGHVATALVAANTAAMAGGGLRAGGGSNIKMRSCVGSTLLGALKPHGGAMKCSPIWSRWTDGITPPMNLIAPTTTMDITPETCGSSAKALTLPTGAMSTSCPSAFSNLKQKLPVYDLVNAGPRNRFTVITDDGPIIVHNCLALGYQGGVGAFQAMAKGYDVTMSDTEANKIKVAWRSANSWAPAFWDDLQTAAMDAIENVPGVMVAAGRVSYQFLPQLLGGTLMCWLPSGAFLAYPQARVKEIPAPWATEDNPDTQFSIVFQHPTYGKSSTYGGALAENCTQAEAASLLRNALVRCEAAGLDTVLHVHDEIVIEVDQGDEECSAGLLKSLMDYVPDWAEGLPLDSEVEHGARYKIPL